MISKRLFWLLYMVPYALLVILTNDYPAELEEGLFNFSRKILSLSGIFASLPYIFRKEGIYNYKWFLGYFILAVVDEWPTYLYHFSFELSYFIVFAIVLLNFVLLYRCLISIKRIHNNF